MCETRVLFGGFFAYFSYSARRTEKAAGAAPTAIIYVVGLTGFEPATSRSRTERSTKLSHNP